MPQSYRKLQVYCQGGIPTRRRSVDGIELADGNLEGCQWPIDQRWTAIERLRADLYGRRIDHAQAHQHAGVDRLWITGIEAHAPRRSKAVLLRRQAGQRCRGLDKRVGHLQRPTLI